MWSSVQPWPLLPIHMSILPDGRVVSFGSPDGYGIQDGRTFDFWSPSLGFVSASHLTTPNAQAIDSFCAGATILPQTGQLLVSGGGSGDGYTSYASTIVSPPTGTVANSGFQLAAQRWYGTMITMADGRPLMGGGGVPYALVEAYSNPSAAAPNISSTPEIFTPGQGWSSLLGATSTDAFGAVNNRAWYPRMWVASDGTIFGISTDKIWQLNPGANTITTLGNFKTAVNNATLPNVGPTSTAVMYDIGKILQVGGNGYNNQDPTNSSSAATTFDITNPSSPVIVDTQSMTYARQWANSLALPDGNVLVTGGSTWGDNAGNDAVYPAEIWHPGTGSWTVGASAAIYRGYHSNTVLLPDGAVLSGGGGAPGPVNNLNVEVYYPPYLFTSNGTASVLAARPQIVSINTVSTNYGNTIQAQMADATPMASASLIGLSSTTHSFNTFGRRVPVTFNQAGSIITVSVPGSPNIAPPGYYLLTVQNAAHVPSRGIIIAVNAPAPVQTEVTARLPVDGAMRSLSLAAAPGNVIRHAYFQAWLNQISPSSVTLDRDDSSFYTRAGMANAQCYSFESKNYPGYFLRHSYFRVLLQQNDNTSGFAADSTFCAVAGLSGTGFSLQSINYPQNFIHVRSGSDVWIDPSDGTAAFAQNASFLLAQQYLPVDGNLHSLANVGASGALVRHANFQAYVSPINSAALAGDIADSSFYFRAGNANPNCYSFEASNYPGYFLRHSNFVLYLQKNDNSALFQADSTFCLAQGLGGQGFSLSSYNYPTMYLNQHPADSTIGVAVSDGSAAFAENATFTLSPTP